MLRFNNRLQFDLMEDGDLVATANARGLLYIEHFRSKEDSIPNNTEGGIISFIQTNSEFNQVFGLWNC